MQSENFDAVKKDKLFLLSPNFENPDYPGRRFYCWHCALIEGVLASFPDLAKQLDVERVGWKRPRQAVIDLVGVENQALPLLVLAEGGLVASKNEILKALVERHGFPEAHP